MLSRASGGLHSPALVAYARRGGAQQRRPGLNARR